MATHGDKSITRPTLHVFTWEQKEFLESDGITERITKDVLSYLKSLGYQVDEYVDPGGRGATGGIPFLDLIREALVGGALLKAIITALPILLRGMSARYKQKEIDCRKAEVNIDIAFSTDDDNWEKSLDPMHASLKLRSMFDMSYYAWSYLSVIYPNYHFNFNVSLAFTYHSSNLNLELNHKKNNAVNRSRINTLISQFQFQPNRSTNIKIEGPFIKRVDHYWMADSDSGPFPKDKVYYLVIPSHLLDDLLIRIRIVKHKLIGDDPS